MEWLASGLRRDVCILLYDEQYRKQELKTALQRRYDRRLRPEQFDGAITALVDGGHIEREVEGIADVLSLTDAGRSRVDAQFAWFREQVE
ncbi:PadR family transcriptional regulator [Halosegnis sp.]|uniref:PadR family transcriptional regulator n=1 Tax=Halosegnis sp. TaxID=2864959 RepID=UPI0035D4DB44